MAVKFPTFADLGFNDPKVTTPLPQYPANDPVAAGEVAFGKGLQQAGGALLGIAGEREEKRQRLNEATASLDLVNRLIPLHTQISTETNPEKIAELRQQYDTMLDTSANAIADPARKLEWKARHAGAVLNAHADADKRVTVLGRERTAVGLQEQVDTASRTAAGSGDADAIGAAQIAIGEALKWGEESGALTPEHRYAMQKRATTQLVSGAAQNLITKGRPADALALLNKHSTDLDPSVAEPLRRSAETAAIKLGGADLANRTAPIGGRGTGEGHVAPQKERIAFTRDYATSKGINPDAVVGTIAGEGLGRYVGDGGTSFGDFQLHVGGGMGDLALAAGINIRDPNTWREQAKFAIDQMVANRDKGAAWYAGQWHGAPGWASSSFAQSGPKAAAPAAAGDTVGVAVGDSIAAHLIRKAGVGGQEDRTAVDSYRTGDTAVSGWSPAQILTLIPRIPEGQIRGKSVILSTGASNGPDELDIIPEQIKELKARGASSVTVLGVGTNTKLAGVNDRLAQIASDNGAVFAGPMRKVAADGIHSSDNADLLAQARGAGPKAGAPAEPAQQRTDWRGWIDRIEADPNASREQKDVAIADVHRRHTQHDIGQAEAASDLALSIGRGAAGRDEVEAAYNAERISPEKRTSFHHAIDKIDEDRATLAEGMAKVGAAGAGGPPLDPKAKNDRAALDYHYAQVSQSWPKEEAIPRAIQYATTYGMVPERLQAMIRGGLHSGRPDQAVIAADAIAQLRRANPQLISEVGDEKDLRFSELILSNNRKGMPAEIAVRSAVDALKVDKTTKEARAAEFDVARGKSDKDRDRGDKSWIEGKANSFWIWNVDPTVDPVMRAEFEAVSKEEYTKTGDLEAARSMALDTVNRVWGRSRVGSGGIRYMRQAPEKFYGVPTLSPDANAAWMNDQLVSDVTAGALQDKNNPVTHDRLLLVPGETSAPDGRPTYVVMLKDATGVYNVVSNPDGTPRRWAPDWQSSAEYKRQQGGIAETIDQARRRRAMPPSSFGERMMQGIGRPLGETLSRGSGEVP